MRNGILHDEAVDLALAERFDQLLAGVEADEPDLAASSGGVERAQHAEGGGLVRAEDALYRGVSGQQVLGGRISGLGGGAAVLVRRDDPDARGTSRRVSRGTLLRARSCSPIPRRSAAPARRRCRRAASPSRSAASAPASLVVGGDEADVVLPLDGRVDDHHGDLPGPGVAAPPGPARGRRAARGRCRRRPGRGRSRPP